LADCRGVTPTVGAARPANGFADRVPGNFTIQRDNRFRHRGRCGLGGTFDRHAPEALEYNPIPKFAYGNPANIFGGRAINADLLRTNYPGMGASPNSAAAAPT